MNEMSPRLFSKESVPLKPVSEKFENPEAQAERELELFLGDPENKFLLDIPKNRERIENATTAVEALQFAKQKSEERMKQTFHFEAVVHLEGVELLEGSFASMKEIIQRIQLGAREIGRGGDAYVVVDRNEIRELPPEICYKFAIAEKTPRGRNTHTEEAELQGKFYEVALHSKAAVGIPTPFYALEMGDKKIIAMEKLHAASIDDILRGRGVLPDWFEIDTFCEELKKLLDAFHDQDLYHRDMHLGNIMISQAQLRVDTPKMGYVIDFGLSHHSVGGIGAYHQEVAGDTFTYNDDYGIIASVKNELHKYRKRKYDGIV